MNCDELSCDGGDELSKGDEKLISPNHESSDLERRDFRHIGDQDGLSETDTGSNDNSSRQPRLPVVRSDFGDRAS